ncbi:hypothetical protein V1277_005602 [Bradyrhizobium sp. AZCC 1588]
MLTRRLSLCLLEFIDAPLETGVSAVGTTTLAHVGADERAGTTRASGAQFQRFGTKIQRKEWLYLETNHAG